MFGWLRPNSCPVDSQAKAWIEQRLRWLTDEFGQDVLLDSPIVLPNDQFFPDKYDGSKGAVRTMFDRVCDWMHVSRETVRLVGYSESSQLQLVNDEGHLLGGTAGTYNEGDEKFVIRIETAQIAEPTHLVGTMAHELAHVRLLGENRIGAEAFDNEILTDLTVVFFGLGIFLANAPRHWHSDLGYWPGTQFRKPEYMTAPMYGYALALRSQLREESAAPLLQHLREASRAEFLQALRFLEADYQKKQQTVTEN